MSAVEFTFKGSMSDLVHLLGGILQKEAIPDRPVSCEDFAGPWVNPAHEAFNRAVAKEERDAETYNKDPLSATVPEADNYAMSIQVGMLRAHNFNFNSVPLDPEAWEVFVQVVKEWQVGFQAPVDENGKPSVPQPNRIALLERIGVGRWPIFILKWIAHHRCLQEAVLQAMETKDVDVAEAIAMTMVQISNTSFPDVADFYDHSTRWRRSKS